MITSAPCATSRRASAAPWPRAPPLTSTTLLSKRAMFALTGYQHRSLAARTAWFKICRSRRTEHTQGSQPTIRHDEHRETQMPIPENLHGFHVHIYFDEATKAKATTV